MIIGLGLAAAALAQLQTPARASFSIGSVRYEIPIPDGYCLPQGADAAAAERTTAGDLDNRTVLFIHSCRRQSGVGARDYTRIFTTRALEDVQVSRAQVLAQLSRPAPVDLDEISRNTSAAIGTPIRLDGQTQNLGHDGVCAYESVVATVSAEVGGRAVSYRQAGATCYTAIGGRVFGIARYGLGTTRQDVARLLRETRALALSVQVRD